ncbi:MAG: DUF971 domain-containing protein [Alphaproteobacteria bacterium]|nr:DUF971 domain-containing protein [Alphaproteobacteria bacterium]
MTEAYDPDKPWPTELRLKDKGKLLAVTFDNGESYEFSAEFLRVESPSAEVKGHGPGQEVTVAGKRNVSILSLEPVGNYAAKLFFSDNHSTGLYAWSSLLTMGRTRDEMWQAYLGKLEAEGKSRN